MNKVTISIADNFSAYPAGRYPEDGDYNATAFRKKWLVPALTDDARVEVTFDDVIGLAASFLDEAFGGLVRNEGMSKEFLDAHLHLTTTEPELEDYVSPARRYIDQAWSDK